MVRRHRDLWRRAPWRRDLTPQLTSSDISMCLNVTSSDISIPPVWLPMICLNVTGPLTRDLGTTVTVQWLIETARLHYVINTYLWQGLQSTVSELECMLLHIVYPSNGIFTASSSSYVSLSLDLGPKYFGNPRLIIVALLWKYGIIFLDEMDNMEWFSKNESIWLNFDVDTVMKYTITFKLKDAGWCFLRGEGTRH